MPKCEFDNIIGDALCILANNSFSDSDKTTCIVVVVKDSADFKYPVRPPPPLFRAPIGVHSLIAGCRAEELEWA